MNYYIIYKYFGEIGYYETNDLQMAQAELDRIITTPGWLAMTAILIDQ